MSCAGVCPRGSNRPFGPKCQPMCECTSISPGSSVSLPRSMSAGADADDSTFAMVAPYNNGGVLEDLPGAIEHTRRADAYLALLRGHGGRSRERQGRNGDKPPCDKFTGHANSQGSDHNRWCAGYRQSRGARLRPRRLPRRRGGCRCRSGRRSGQKQRSQAGGCHLRQGRRFSGGGRQERGRENRGRVRRSGRGLQQRGHSAARQLQRGARAR